MDYADAAIKKGIKKTGDGPRFFFGRGSARSGAEDAQREALADGLGAILDVELSQDLLHVVLHRERADLEDRADLDVALAEVDPLQDLLLAHGEQAHAAVLGGRALDRAVDLGAQPGPVQEGNDQLDEVRLPGADRPGLAGEHEEARELAGRVVGSVGGEAARADAVQLARERAAGEAAAA